MEKYKALQNINLNQLKEFITKYLESLFLKSLVQGNISAKVAQKTVTDFLKHLKSSALPEKVCSKVI